VEREGRKGRKERFGFASFAGFAFLVLAAPAIAQPPHVRGEGGMHQLIDDAARRSPEIRGSIDRLQDLDVTVYVRGRALMQPDLDGRIALLSVAAGHRYLIIELACGRSELTQMATLGHELFHAIEIAEEPSAVSPETLAALYARIGSKTGERLGLRTYETEAAAAAGMRARRQLLTNATRHGNGT
jgi:hypothetical protein